MQPCICILCCFGERLKFALLIGLCVMLRLPCFYLYVEAGRELCEHSGKTKTADTTNVS